MDAHTAKTVPTRIRGRGALGSCCRWLPVSPRRGSIRVLQRGREANNPGTPEKSNREGGGLTGSRQRLQGEKNAVYSPGSDKYSGKGSTPAQPGIPSHGELREGAGARAPSTAGPTRVRVGTPAMCMPPGRLNEGISSALRRSPGGDEGGAE